jgi:hypothetical protein
MTEPDLDNLVLIVVGAHLRAELHERAAAYQLRDAVAAAVAAKWSAARNESTQAAAAGAGATPPAVAVITDLWRLNDQMLAPLPQISIGHPGVNALSAFLADKVPPAFVIDGELAVQFDAAAPEAIAVCWGVDHAATCRAVDEFAARYLDSFADAVLRELAT